MYNTEYIRSTTGNTFAQGGYFEYTEAGGIKMPIKLVPLAVCFLWLFLVDQRQMRPHDKMEGPCCAKPCIPSVVYYPEGVAGSTDYGP